MKASVYEWLIPVVVVVVLAAVMIVPTIRMCGASEPPVLISEHDGVRLWRVRHGGQAVYFTTPGGDVTWYEQQGKVPVKRQTISGMRGE